MLRVGRPSCGGQPGGFLSEGGSQPESQVGSVRTRPGSWLTRVPVQHSLVTPSFPGQWMGHFSEPPHCGMGAASGAQSCQLAWNSGQDWEWPQVTSVLVYPELNPIPSGRGFWNVLSTQGQAPCTAPRDGGQGVTAPSG